MNQRRFTRLGAALALAALATVSACGLSGCATLSGAGRISALRERFLQADGPVMVVAHRACWKQTAENSIAAISACKRLGVDMVELDVQRTRDGHLVLMHDSTVDRMTNGSGAVADLTLAQIKALRLKAGAGGPAAPLTGEAPPTFAEAMAAARGALLVNIDAKGDVNLQALGELERMGMVRQALFKSPAPPGDPTLAGVADRPELLFMPILREADGTSLRAAPDRYRLRPPAYEVTFDTEDYFRDGATALRARSARVWVNTLQRRHAAGHVDADALAAPEAHWGRLIGMGANMIQTDEPGALVAWLKACGCGAVME